MKTISSVISSLNKVGLTESANKLRHIEILQKQAAADFSKEIETLESLRQVVGYFQGKSLDERAPSGMTFPPYAIETDSKYISYSGDPLEDFSKREIFSIGIPNFLQNFTKQYMGYRGQNLSGLDKRLYDSALEELSEMTSEVKAYKKVSKPIRFEESARKQKHTSRANVKNELTALNTAKSHMNKFVSQVEERYVPLLASSYGGYYEDDELIITEEVVPTPKPEPKSKPKPEFELPDLSPENPQEEVESKQDGYSSQQEDAMSILEQMNKWSSIKVAEQLNVHGVYESTLRELSNLSYNFRVIRDEIDGDMANRLGMSIEDFRTQADIDDLLYFETTKVASNETSILELYEQKLDKMKKKDKKHSNALSREQEAKKAVRDVLSGKPWKVEVPKGSRRRKTVLYDPEVIFNAWDYLIAELKIAYKVFVEAATLIFLSRQSHQNRSTKYRESEKAKYISEREEEQKEALLSIDRELLSKLEAAINILRG